MSRAVFEQAWNDALPRIQAIRTSLANMAPAEPRIMRVGQLDSELLDQELLQLLKEPISKSLDALNSRLRTLFDPELTLIVRMILYKYSMWDNAASYGAKLQNLRYASLRKPAGAHLDTRLPRTLLLTHATLTVLLPYAHSRLRGHALSESWPDAPSFTWKRRLWRILSRGEGWYTLLGLLNFMLFLWNGRYRTLVDRLLGFRLMPVTRLLSKNVSYEFMNRQMVWHAFTEFLLFFLPIINTRKLKRTVTRAISKVREMPMIPSALRSLPAIDQASGGVIRKGKYAMLPEQQCAICAEDAAFDINALLSNTTQELDVAPSLSAAPPPHPLNIPYTTSCGHSYCYTCIADRMLRAADDGDESWECLRCDAPVKGAVRLEQRDKADEEVEGAYSTSDGFELDELSSDHTFETLSSDALSD